MVVYTQPSQLEEDDDEHAYKIFFMTFAAVVLFTMLLLVFVS